MSLVKCKKCGKEINNQVGNCPYCGHPVKSNDIDVPNEKKDVNINNKKKQKKKLFLFHVLLLPLL